MQLSPSYSDNGKFSSYIQANTVYKMHNSDSRHIWQLKLKSQWWQAATHYTVCLMTVVNPEICNVWDERSIISTANWNTGNLRHMYQFWDICSKWEDRIRHGQVEWRKAAIEKAHFLLQYASNSSKTRQYLGIADTWPRFKPMHKHSILLQTTSPQHPYLPYSIQDTSLISKTLTHRKENTLQ